MHALRMTRCDSVRLVPDARRVITKPFLPGEEIYPDGSSRLQVVLERVMALSEREVGDTLAHARQTFAGRHRDLDADRHRRSDAPAPPRRR